MNTRVMASWPEDRLMCEVPTECVKIIPSGKSAIARQLRIKVIVAATWQRHRDRHNEQTSYLVTSHRPVYTARNNEFSEAKSSVL